MERLNRWGNLATEVIAAITVVVFPSVLAAVLGLKPLLVVLSVEAEVAGILVIGNWLGILGGGEVRLVDVEFRSIQAQDSASTEEFGHPRVLPNEATEDAIKRLETEIDKLRGDMEDGDRKNASAIADLGLTFDGRLLNMSRDPGTGLAFVLVGLVLSAVVNLLPS